MNTDEKNSEYFRSLNPEEMTALDRRLSLSEAVVVPLLFEVLDELRGYAPERANEYESYLSSWEVNRPRPL